MSESGPLVVCIVCVVPVETEAVVRVFSRRLKRQFKKKFDQSVGEFREISLKNSRREVVRIVLSWLPRYGPVEMALHLPRLFNFFHPRFVVMPGICAGDPTKTSLGDLVLAERAFMYEEGKTTLSANDEVRHLPDTRTHEINDQLLTFAKAFREWQGAGHRLSRPQSMMSRRERVLAAVLSVISIRLNDTYNNRYLRELIH